jgi:hypothetical protein
LFCKFHSRYSSNAFLKNGQENSHFKRNGPEGQLSKETRDIFRLLKLYKSESRREQVPIENDTESIVEELLNKFTLNDNTLKRYEESLQKYKAFCEEKSR